MNPIYFIPVSGIIALVFVYVKNKWVASNDVGSKKMERIAKNISDGAMAFLKAEYKILSMNFSTNLICKHSSRSTFEAGQRNVNYLFACI